MTSTTDFAKKMPRSDDTSPTFTPNNVIESPPPPSHNHFPRGFRAHFFGRDEVELGRTRVNAMSAVRRAGPKGMLTSRDGLCD